MIVAVASGKGGVGKSTTTVNLAAGLAALGLAPTIVDTDPSGDAGWLLGFRASEAATDFLRAKRTLADATVRSSEGLAIVPGGPSLIAFDSSPAEPIARRLRDLAAGTLLLIDTAPGYGALTRAVLLAADVVLVPFVPEPAAERRAKVVFDVLDGLGVAPEVVAVATMVDRRRSLTRTTLAAARTAFPIVGEIDRAVLVVEAGEAALSVIAAAPESASADQFRRLAAAIADFVKPAKGRHARSS